MSILQILNLIYQELAAEGGAQNVIVRLDIDAEANAGQSRVVAIAREKYVSALVDDDEWEHPSAPEAIGAALLHMLDEQTET